jgi:hypothetical protein
VPWRFSAAGRRIRGQAVIPAAENLHKSAHSRVADQASPVARSDLYHHAERPNLELPGAALYRPSAQTSKAAGESVEAAWVAIYASNGTKLTRRLALTRSVHRPEVPSPRSNRHCACSLSVVRKTCKQAVEHGRLVVGAIEMIWLFAPRSFLIL